MPAPRTAGIPAGVTFRSQGGIDVAPTFLSVVGLAAKNAGPTWKANVAKCRKMSHQKKTLGVASPDGAMVVPL
jgi:hypothetical protein